jgi:hypothetical protein
MAALLLSFLILPGILIGVNVVGMVKGVVEEEWLTLVVGACHGVLNSLICQPCQWLHKKELSALQRQCSLPNSTVLQHREVTFRQTNKEKLLRDGFMAWP